MTDTVWKRNEVESPCVKLCIVHPDTRMCVGCFRRLDEISQWSQMTNEQRATIMQKLPSRQAQPGKRRGGRAARRAP